MADEYGEKLAKIFDVPKSRADIEEALETLRSSLKNMEGPQGAPIEYPELYHTIRGNISGLEWVLRPWPKGRTPR